MAFGMKHWIGLTVSGLALIAAWKLPPEVLSPRPAQFQLPEETRYNRLKGELTEASEIVTRLRLDRAISQEVLREESGGFAVLYPEGVDEAELKARIEALGGTLEGYRRGTWDGPERETIVALTKVTFSDEARRAFEDGLRREVQGLDRRSDVAFGYAFVDPRRFAVDTHAPPRRLGSIETYVGVREGRAYCMRVQTDSWFDDNDLIRASRAFDGSRWQTGVSTLAYCRPFVRFGMPGPHILAWLRDGALNFTARSPDVVDREGPETIRRRRYFGVESRANFGGFRGQSIEVDRCLAGIPEGCTRTFTDPAILRGGDGGLRIVDATNALGLGTLGWNTPFGMWDDYLLGDLEAEFGADAVAAFWTSDRPVAEAFKDAFDTELGDWAVTWVERQFGIQPPGPRLSRTAALGGLLTVMLMGAWAGAWARRRTVA